MNKMIDGKQLTVAWHVDDLRALHVLSTVVDQFIKDLVEDEFGKEAPLNKLCRKIHDYLGMKLDFSKPREVTITMIDYIKSVSMMCQRRCMERLSSQLWRIFSK